MMAVKDLQKIQDQSPHREGGFKPRTFWLSDHILTDHRFTESTTPELDFFTTAADTLQTAGSAAMSDIIITETAAHKYPERSQQL